MSFPAPFNIERDEDPRRPGLTVSGELDSASAEVLSASFSELLREDGAAAGRVRLDLSAVSFVDSTGMRTIIALQRAATERGVELTIAAPPEDVTALLRVAGVAQRVRLEGAVAPERGNFVERVEVELQAEPGAPRRARTEVRALLEPLAGEATLGSAVLLVSELVTNAVVHGGAAGRPIRLTLTLYGDAVRAEVRDGGDGFDPAEVSARMAQQPAGMEGGGRGLFLVDSCATRWGIGGARDGTGDGFLVWFELDQEQAA